MEPENPLAPFDALFAWARHEWQLTRPGALAPDSLAQRVIDARANYLRFAPDPMPPEGVCELMYRKLTDYKTQWLALHARPAADTENMPPAPVTPPRRAPQTLADALATANAQAKTTGRKPARNAKQAAAAETPDTFVKRGAAQDVPAPVAADPPPSLALVNFFE